MHNKSKKEIAKVKQKIINLFNANVRGKKANTTGSNVKHDGKGGHWLEVQMKVKHNASNTPDIDGFEMKNETGSKTTFGDWSPNYYIYKDKSFSITRDDFLKMFGKPNLEKQGRYSWSGEPCPKINTFNTFGQKLFVDESKNILVIYSYSKDKRVNKSRVIPKSMQKNNLIIAK